MACKSCKSSGSMIPEIKKDENLGNRIIKYIAKTIGFLVAVALLPIINLVIIWFMFETIVLNKDVDIRAVVSKYITDRNERKEDEEEDEEEDDYEDLTEDDVIMLNVEDITNKSK